MAKKDPYASLKFKEFKLFLIMRFALVFAWSMQFVIIEWKVYKLTGDALSLGVIGLMEIIPALGMALFAGHIVDKSEKKSLLMKCIAGFSCISFGLFYLTIPSVVEQMQQHILLYCIYALVFLGGIVRSFIGPSIFSLVAMLVPKTVYPNAATWSSSTWQIGSVGGASLGGLAIHYLGVHWSLCFVFALALIALFSLSLIKKKPILNTKKDEPILESLKAGLQFVFSTKAILGALTLDMIAVLFGGAIALLPVFATDILEAGSREFGLMRAAPAVGAFITLLSTAHLSIAKNAGKKLLIAVFIFGLSIILFGLSKSFYLSLFALFLSGLADGISVVIRSTILQLKTPDDMKGRVASVNSMFVGSSNELGAFESGLAAKLFGPVMAVVGGGCITLLTVITTAVKSPTFRKLDLTNDLQND